MDGKNDLSAVLQPGVYKDVADRMQRHELHCAYPNAECLHVISLLIWLQVVLAQYGNVARGDAVESRGNAFDWATE